MNYCQSFSNLVLLLKIIFFLNPFSTNPRFQHSNSIIEFGPHTCQNFPKPKYFCWWWIWFYKLKTILQYVMVAKRFRFLAIHELWPPWIRSIPITLDPDCVVSIVTVHQTVWKEVWDNNSIHAFDVQCRQVDSRLGPPFWFSSMSLCLLGPYWIYHISYIMHHIGLLFRVLSLKY